MGFKDRFLWIFLIIITFGLIQIYWKKQKSPEKNYLSVSEKIPFEMTKFYQTIGSLENIQNCAFTHNKVRVDLKDIRKIDQQSILNLRGISGVVISSSSVNIIVGNSAKKIAEQILTDKGL